MSAACGRCSESQHGQPKKKRAVAQFLTMGLHIAEEKAAEKEKHIFDIEEQTASIPGVGVDDGAVEIAETGVFRRPRDE